MKLKKFESLENTIFGEFFITEDKYHTLHDKILRLISEWLKENEEISNKFNMRKYKFVNFYITRNEDNPFGLESSFKDNIIIDKKSFEDLIEFIKDPDLYKKAKKYNIL